MVGWSALSGRTGRAWSRSSVSPTATISTRRAVSPKSSEFAGSRRREIRLRHARTDPGNQPVHPLRRHREGSATVLEPRGARCGGAALIAAFAAALRQLGAHVEAGVFGAHMQVELVNDGPVTVMLEG